MCPKKQYRNLIKERNRVTVCIGAICRASDEDKSGRIVVCHDWQQETYLSHSDTADKFRTLPRGWVALMCGTLSRAEELVAQYETKLQGLQKVDDDLRLFEAMKEPAFLHKRSLADEYTKQSLGMPYAKFLELADKLPDDFVTGVLETIGKIKLGAEIIIAGFISTGMEEGGDNEPLPYIFTVSDDIDLTVRVDDSFSVVGSGSYVAIPALSQREQSRDKSLMETIYAVYEAKRLSEIVPGVGPTQSISVVGPKGKFWEISDAGFERCREIFRKIGPKLGLSDAKKKGLFAMEPSFLEMSEEIKDSSSSEPPQPS